MEKELYKCQLIIIIIIRVLSLFHCWGLAHLEALEMISNQSESKVQGSLSTLSGDNLQSLKTELIEIRDAFQLEDLESEDQPGEYHDR